MLRSMRKVPEDTREELTHANPQEVSECMRRMPGDTSEELALGSPRSIQRYKKSVRKHKRRIAAPISERYTEAREEGLASGVSLTASCSFLRVLLCHNVMGLPLLLFLPFYAVLLLPVCSFLLYLVKLLCQAILCIFWKQARTHFALWPPDSSFLGHHRLTAAGEVPAAPSKPLPHERLGVRRYEGKAAGDEEQSTECVFCLCSVEEGDEVRELRCEHLFHRGCLDKWLEHGRATCPLCRRPLLPPGSSKADQFFYSDAAEEEALPDDLMGLPLTVFIRSSLLLW